MEKVWIFILLILAIIAFFFIAGIIPATIVEKIKRKNEPDAILYFKDHPDGTTSATFMFLVPIDELRNKKRLWTEVQNESEKVEDAPSQEMHGA